MKNLIEIYLAILFLTAPFFAAAQNREKDFRVLAEGSQSSVEKPFIFAARDAKTYLQLHKLVANLPQVSEIDFKNFAVIAAFAGTKPTGGFNVEYQKRFNKIHINLISPPKSAMVTQMLTQPFKVVQIPLAENQSLNFTAASYWMREADNFLILRSGYFSFSGGIAGIKREFNARGKIHIWRYENYTTAFFDLQGMRNARKRYLSDYASGLAEGNKLNFSRVDAGNFVENPHPPFYAEANLNGGTFNVKFKSQETKFADGFIGEGSFTASKFFKK